jgi:capsular polysaccharide transport system permease protein
MLEKIRSYRDEITKQRAQIAGDDASMAGKLSAYDSLILDRELAARGLEAAIVHLTGAREDAERQQLYLQTIVEPNLADQSLFPRRGLTILFVLGISLCIYWIAKAFIGSVMEHQA